jgi:hypothetical protein
MTACEKFRPCVQSCASQAVSPCAAGRRGVNRGGLPFRPAEWRKHREQQGRWDGSGRVHSGRHCHTQQQTPTRTHSPPPALPGSAAPSALLCSRSCAIASDPLIARIAPAAAGVSATASIAAGAWAADGSRSWRSGRGTPTRPRRSRTPPAPHTVPATCACRTRVVRR